MNSRACRYFYSFSQVYVRSVLLPFRALVISFMVPAICKKCLKFLTP